MVSQLENELGFIKDCWGVYGQNSRVNSVHVDGWIAELAIIASNATERILYTLVTTFIKNYRQDFCSRYKFSVLDCQVDQIWPAMGTSMSGSCSTMNSQLLRNTQTVFMSFDVVSIRAIRILIVTVRKRSCGKVMFLHLSVILSTGGVSAPVHAGIHPPPKQTPQEADTPQQTATAADGTHPTGMHSCFKTSSTNEIQMKRSLQ